jgi:hypothetical protein
VALRCAFSSRSASLRGGLRREEGFLFDCFPAVKTAGYCQSSPAGTWKAKASGDLCVNRFDLLRYARSLGAGFGRKEGLSVLRCAFSGRSAPPSAALRVSAYGLKLEGARACGARKGNLS